MERGGTSNQCIKYTYSRRPKSGVAVQEPNAATNTPTATANAPTGGRNPSMPPGFKREPDQYMPIANVARIMRGVLPANARIADDAKETIQECVSEFISFITSEANGKCHRECRKTVTPEDVLVAMESLGFDEYVETLSVYLNKFRANDPDRVPVQQAPLVRHAPPSFVQRPVARRPPPAPYVPQPPTYAADDGNYSEFPGMADFFMGNQGGGEGSSKEMEEFDPFK